MSIDFAALVAVGVEVAGGVGATSSAVITRPKTPPNPLTGVQTGTDITQTVDVLQVDARKMRRKGDAWATASVVLFVASNACRFEPKVGDKVYWSRKNMRMTARDDYSPTGSTIGYFLGCG